MVEFVYYHIGVIERVAICDVDGFVSMNITSKGPFFSLRQTHSQGGSFYAVMSAEFFDCPFWVPFEED